MEMDDLLETICPIKRYKWWDTPTLFIIAGGKGGIGKSLAAQILISLLGVVGALNVKVVDADHGNSSTTQIHSAAQMVDIAGLLASGVFVLLAQGLAKGEYDHIVVDLPAGRETDLQNLLPKIRQMYPRIVIIRPITTGSHNQSAAIQSMPAMQQLSCAVVFAKNLGQGRSATMFERWDTSEARARAIEMGAAEAVIEDAGIQLVDEAIALGLSIADVGIGNFAKICDAADREDAKKIFSPDTRAHLILWLRTAMRSIGDAIDVAMQNVERKSPDTGKLPLPRGKRT